MLWGIWGLGWTPTTRCTVHSTDLWFLASVKKASSWEQDWPIPQILWKSSGHSPGSSIQNSVHFPTFYKEVQIFFSFHLKVTERPIFVSRLKFEIYLYHLVNFLLWNSFSLSKYNIANGEVIHPRMCKWTWYGP